MASKKGGKTKRIYYQAKLVTNVGACVFCQRAVDDEIIYGKLYAIGDIQCHYFCALLSCCLLQKGNDEDGLFGFLYPDILAEVERSKKHKCSYCNREGANIGCSVTQCRKQFHLPCGRERDAVSLFFGNYKTFCSKHAPKQNILGSLMPVIRTRIASQKQHRSKRPLNIVMEKPGDDLKDPQVAETLCVICYEQVEGYPSPRTFWPPCCARDAWFHRRCLQRMALSAGMHFLKCPLCNDRETFYAAVVNQGYYIPDRDAAWELEQNAFADIYERPVVCSAVVCKCPGGRDHDTDSGLWGIKLCILCGSTATHAGCTDKTQDTCNVYICDICKPATPDDLERLLASIEKVQQQEQVTEIRHGPIMPSRMSLRRTKRKPFNSGPSSSRNASQVRFTETDTNKTDASRLELNLKKPARRILEPAAKNIENILLSPMKMFQQGLTEKMGERHTELVDMSNLMEKLREKLKKPRPLVVKKRIINNILDELFNSTLPEQIGKIALKEWNSPKKSLDKTENCKGITDVKTIEKIDIKENSIHVTDNIYKTEKISQHNTTIIHERVLDEMKYNDEQDKPEDGSKLRSALLTTGNRLKRKLVKEDIVPEKKKRIEEPYTKEQCKDSFTDECTNEININTSMCQNVELIDGKSNEDFFNTVSEEKVVYNALKYPISCDVTVLAKECIDLVEKKGTKVEADSVLGLDIGETDIGQRDESVYICVSNKSGRKVKKCSLKRKRGETNKDSRVETVRCDFVEEIKDLYRENVESKIVGVVENVKSESGIAVFDETLVSEDNAIDRSQKYPIDYDNVKNLGIESIKSDLVEEKATKGEIEACLGVDIGETDIGQRVGSVNKSGRKVKKCNSRRKQRGLNKDSRVLTEKIDLVEEITNLNKENLKDSVGVIENVKSESSVTELDETLVTNNNNVNTCVIDEENDDIKPVHKNNVKKRDIKRKRDEKSDIVSKMSNGKCDFVELKTDWDENITDNTELDNESKEIKKDMDDKVRTGKRRKDERCRNISNRDTKRKERYLKKSIYKSNNGDLDRRKCKKRINLSLNDTDEIKLKYDRRQKRKISTRNNDIKVKIKWKKVQLKLRITEQKNKGRKMVNVKSSPEPEKTPKVFKQYLLKYSPEVNSQKDVIIKPVQDVTPTKRKYVKKLKRTDNMIQTNISNFFKVSPNT